MKRTNLSLFIVATSCFVNPVAQASAQPSPFTPEQEARIGEIAADYLVAHPDVLVTVSKKLQEHQLQREQLRYAGRVMNNQRELLKGSAWKTESMVTPVFATPILTTSWLA